MAAKGGCALVSILALLTIVCACGGGSSNMQPPPSKSDFLYAVTLSGPPNNLSFQLSNFKVDASTGALSSPFTTTFESQFVPGMAVDPTARFLYASYPKLGADAIGIFTLDPNTGVPTQTSVYSLVVICPFCPPPSGPGELTLAPNGEYLYYGSSTLGAGVSQGIGALAVDRATGTLSSVPGSPFPADQAPSFLSVHPSGKFVYTENIDASGAGGNALRNISGFAVDSNTGALAPVPTSPFAPPVLATVGGLAIHPSGKFLYASSGLGANGILGWSIDGATGELKVLPDSPYQVGVETYGAVFTPSGSFFYTSAGPAGGILGFRVDSNSGTLTPLSRSPFSPGLRLGDPVIEPTGLFLFAQDGVNSAIDGFSIDSSTGALVALGNPVPIGARAISMEIVKAP